MRHVVVRSGTPTSFAAVVYGQPRNTNPDRLVMRPVVPIPVRLKSRIYAQLKLTNTAWLPIQVERKWHKFEADRSGRYLDCVFCVFVLLAGRLTRAFAVAPVVAAEPLAGVLQVSHQPNELPRS
jgi:hypothetical protein